MSRNKIAAEHFFRRGFRSTAFYRNALTHAGSLRFRAFKRHVERVGHKVIDLVPPSSWSDEENSWLRRQHWLSQRLVDLQQPVAVFAHDDSSGVEVIEACQSESIAIPDGVAVLGMLDIAMFRESTTVPLSSIVVDFDTHTRIACDLLALMMAGEPPPKEPILLPPTGIAVRESTDTIAAHTPVVANAIRFILDHFSEPIGVPDVARAVGMSQTPFYRACHADLGCPPGSVLSRIRLEKAKSMLIESDETVHNVAAACGFGDRINLHRQFKKQLGISPAAYRKAEQAKRGKRGVAWGL
ncbi:MAG: substrate-binding domain-containing protein [Verrucomicrobia bacterium]|nr:substrate-binding domain-containing protein [Verrucomicrobiota bacterium]MBT7068900.1 substrate-binding domain-containing protein [Verrucomicrobiota bacterium]MBT7699683.1 substrate-binding domain-containing protein [Verrucomicrobiota bacterium]